MFAATSEQHGHALARRGKSEQSVPLGGIEAGGANGHIVLTETTREHHQQCTFGLATRNQRWPTVYQKRQTEEKK